MNYTTGMNWTPLLYASKHGTAFFVDILLDAGADLNVKAKNNVTPLFVAIVFRRSLLAEEYLDKGAVFYPINLGPVSTYETGLCYRFAANHYHKKAALGKAKENFQLAIKYFSDAIPALKSHSGKLALKAVLSSTMRDGQQLSSYHWTAKVQIDEYIKKCRDYIAECQQKLTVL